MVYVILARFQSTSSVVIVFIRTAWKFEMYRVVALGDDLRDVVPPPRTQLGGVGVIYSVIEYPYPEFAAVCAILKATPDQRNARPRLQPLCRCLCSVVVSLSGWVVSMLFLHAFAASPFFYPLFSFSSFLVPLLWLHLPPLLSPSQHTLPPQPLALRPFLMFKAFITAKHSCQLKVHDRSDLVAIPTYCHCSGPTLRGIPADCMDTTSIRTELTFAFNYLLIAWDFLLPCQVRVFSNLWKSAKMLMIFCEWVAGICLRWTCGERFKY